jgi:6-phospho-beta-glucosidase
MKPLKIAVVGAGSTYTPELLDGFIRRKDRLAVAELRLMDTDREKGNVIAALAERMFKKAGLAPSFLITEDLNRALDGADYVIAQIRVGGLAARIRDEKIPLKYGLMGQETTGIGGMMNALRTIPVILDLARRMERLCPRGTLINFSNPSGLVAQAVANQTTVRMWGLCNGPINMVRHLQNLLPQGVKNFDYDFVGLNHLCWITAAYADGVDILPTLLAQGASSAILKNIDGIDYPPDLRSAVPYLPIAYLNYFYFRNQELKALQGAIKSRGEVVQEIEKELLASYRDPALNEKPLSLEKRGGALYSEAAVSLIEAVENDTGAVHVIDVPNRGSYDFMDDDDVVEVKCRIDAQGAHPIPMRGFSHPVVISLVRTLKAYEKLAARAALTGDRSAALGALLVHPLVGDYSAASSALEEMLLANRDYLPQFFPQT